VEASKGSQRGRAIGVKARKLTGGKLRGHRKNARWQGSAVSIVDKSKIGSRYIRCRSHGFRDHPSPLESHFSPSSSANNTVRYLFILNKPCKACKREGASHWFRQRGLFPPCSIHHPRPSPSTARRSVVVPCPPASSRRAPPSIRVNGPDAQRSSGGTRRTGQVDPKKKFLGCV
jgi:hypothetical protein